MNLGIPKKVVALSNAVLADFPSQMLVRVRIRPESARFDEWRLSTNLQPSLCPSLVLDMLFLLLEVVYLVVDSSGTDHFIVMHKTPYTSITIEAFQQRFRRFLV